MAKTPRSLCECAARSRMVMLLAAAVLGMLSGLTAAAHAAPAITDTGYTNPVASELKSLQTTNFYATFDQPVWAVLTIHDGKGTQVAKVFDGPAAKGGERFWFPAWNGRGPDGRMLPSSAGYTWKLLAVRGAQRSEVSGRIAVCRILFTRRGVFRLDDFGQRGELGMPFGGYMIDGAANIYVRVVMPADEHPGNCSLRFWDDRGWMPPEVDRWWRPITPDPTLTVSRTYRLVSPSRGMKNMEFESFIPAWFEFTVLQ